MKARSRFFISEESTKFRSGNFFQVVNCWYSHVSVTEQSLHSKGSSISFILKVVLISLQMKVI